MPELEQQGVLVARDGDEDHPMSRLAAAHRLVGPFVAFVPIGRADITGVDAEPVVNF